MRYYHLGSVFSRAGVVKRADNFVEFRVENNLSSLRDDLSLEKKNPKYPVSPLMCAALFWDYITSELGENTTQHVVRR